jgi:cobalt-zinc-cadmium efflux system outer membrane protein
MPISFDCFRTSLPDFPAGEVRRHAVVNRADILSALSEYAAAESALQLEIAKQYPDIRVGPGYQLDQTDNKWTIGVALDLPVFNRNRGPIAEAEARREESAARFLSLQTEILGELDAAIEDCRAALRKCEAAGDLLTDITRQAKVAGTRHELGEISTLEYLEAELELNASRQARLDALVQAQEAVGRLENAAQSPLDVKDWIYVKPQGLSDPVKEPKDE